MRNTRSSSRQRRRFKVVLGHAPCFTIDVGAGGFCTELLLVPGTAVEGSISAKGTEFAFAGRVAWAKPGDARMGLRGRMGVCFTQVSPDFLHLVELPSSSLGHAGQG
jgi:hypothetical protein